MLPEPLTETQLTTISAKIDDIAMLFLGVPMDATRQALYIRTLCTYAPFPYTFDKLCVALDRTMERWEHPGKVPTPHFIMSTIDPRY